MTSSSSSSSRDLNPNADVVANGDELTISFPSPDQPDRNFIATRAMMMKKQMMVRATTDFINWPEGVEVQDRWIFSEDGGTTWITLDRAIERNWLK